MSDRLYAVKMRASSAEVHISGAEKIVPAATVPKTAAQLVERALTHAKGVPDFVNLKVLALSQMRHLKSLPVTTYRTTTAAEGRDVAARLLREAGVTRIDEILSRFAETHQLRGALLLDADTLERLDPPTSRGVRATSMDDAESALRGSASGKNHYAEAVVLATKVASAPNIVGEICVSDDPDYVTGYVATPQLGYCRLMTVKEKGDSKGGRIFLYRGPHDQVAETIRYLEETPVIVEDVPMLADPMTERRWDGIRDELAAIESAGLSRHCTTFEAPTGSRAKVGNRELIVLSSNDYLDLASDPRVTAAAAEAARRWGAGSGGSRLTTGTQPPHVALEDHLARFKGTEAAITWATGYMANVGTITALVRKGDVILSDALNHASIIDGCRLSGAEVFVYRHNDRTDLEHKLAMTREYRRRLVVSDGVFSMDGDLLDLPRFVEICQRYDAFSMIDEAHATGVIGNTGRGLVEHFGCAQPDIQLGTLSKALGSEGGYVCGRRELIDYLRNRSRSFIFSTAPSAASAAAADAALSILEAEPERVRRLASVTRLFVSELNRLGVQAQTQSAIVPILIGEERKALAVAAAVKERGYLIPAIRYPTVAKGSARLRATMMATLDDSLIRQAAATIGSLVGKM